MFPPPTFNEYESIDDDSNPFSPKKPSIKRSFSIEPSCTITPPKSSSSDCLIDMFSIPMASPECFKTPLKLVKPDPNIFSHSGYKTKRNCRTMTPSSLRFRVKAKFSPSSKVENIHSSQSSTVGELLLTPAIPRTPTKKSNTKFLFMSENGPSTSPIRRPAIEFPTDCSYSEHDIVNDSGREIALFTELHGDDPLTEMMYLDPPSSPKRLDFNFLNNDQVLHQLQENEGEDVETRNVFLERKVTNGLNFIIPPVDYNVNGEVIQGFFESHYRVLELIGSGSFAQVFKVCKTNTPSQVSCVKKSKNAYQGTIDRSTKLEEVTALWSVRGHPNCVNILAAWEESGFLFIETEYCENGSLLDLINGYSGTQIREEIIWGLLSDIIEGLSHIHTQGFVHLDLKPENILLERRQRQLESSTTYKIADFGLARRITEGCVDNIVVCRDFEDDDITEGDKIYLAPEILSGRVGPAADLFSLGLIALELAANIELPSQGDSWQLLRGERPLEGISLVGISEHLQQLIAAMLSSDPDARPTVSEVRSLAAQVNGE